MAVSEYIEPLGNSEALCESNARSDVPGLRLASLSRWLCLARIVASTTRFGMRGGQNYPLDGAGLNRSICGQRDWEPVSIDVDLKPLLENLLSHGGGFQQAWEKKRQKLPLP